MNGISIGREHPRSCSGEKTLRRCRNHEEPDNVIVIDVDADNFEYVDIIDVPESLPPKTKRSSMHKKDKEWSVTNVICIDDDESSEASHSFNVKGSDFSVGATSNGESCRVNTKYFGINESKFGQDVMPPVRLSNCKRTYSGNCFTRNRYGLDADYESDSSDSDYLDCELVEDSSGKVQEQWEKAYTKRRKDFQNGYRNIRDHDSSSRGVGVYDHQNFEVDDMARQRNEAPSSSSKGKFNNRKDDPLCSGTEEGSKFCQSCAFDAGIEHEPGTNWESPCLCSFLFSEQSHKEFDQSKTTFENVDASEVGPCFPKSKSCACQGPYCRKSCLAEDEATICVSKNLFETKAKPSESFSGDNCKNFTDMAIDDGENIKSSQPHEMENLMPQRCGLNRSMLSSKQLDHSSSLLSNDLETEFHERDSQLTDDTSLSRNYINETNVQEDNSVVNIHLENDEDGQLHSPNGEFLPSSASCIISDREKLKETDEYKRAMKEEWASRQRAIQIQAEEAKRLKCLQRRRVAESMRLLDMERRQKERIEEVRNSQRKDEENMNLKEKIRAEVRIKLNKVEVSCHNMASLLHSLGIRVGGWPNPLPQEVQTAFKRALLTFHPDRTSLSDIRQQVEAEEKFKLINRLKEKF